jgi:RHS repeat-associated protein
VDVEIADYNHFGKPGRISYPAFDTDIGYFSRTGRVSRITVPGLMDLSYTYSQAGDMRSIHDSVRNFAYTYQYDDLHRLTHESAAGPFKIAQSRTLNLDYNGSQAHGVSQVSADGEQRNLNYDDNGNMTGGYDFSRPGQFPERRMVYNAENMPLSIEYEPQGEPVTTLAFTYDGDGRRVKKESTGGTVIYVDNSYEIRNGQPVKYIFAGSLRLAKVSGTTVHYYHKDHLGSSSIVTDASGTPVDAMVYEAFGQPRETCEVSSGNVAYTYTDQEWDAESGLYNYDARLYDAVLGRFLSADSVVPDWYDMQALDRYSYTLNNPLKYVDPDGHAFVLGSAAYWAINSLFAGTTAYYANNAIGESPDLQNQVSKAIKLSFLLTSKSLNPHVWNEVLNDNAEDGADGSHPGGASPNDEAGSDVQSESNKTKLKAKDRKEIEKKKENEKKHGNENWEEPASEDYAKWKAKQLEKRSGKDARRKAHDKPHLRDRSKSDLDKDYD